ncbi:hypothetical protein [Bacillus marinisedimentorum]|uniref:hypothetical protein n=1 Tax=Bacillus marinisedimentorum TaxID=1821260 RepID=UPI0007DEA8A8|nr:hypothetical protein [Bacillus marinisedimentorum]
MTLAGSILGSLTVVMAERGFIPFLGWIRFIPLFLSAHIVFRVSMLTAETAELQQAGSSEQVE